MVFVILHIFIYIKIYPSYQGTLNLKRRIPYIISIVCRGSDLSSTWFNLFSITTFSSPLQLLPSTFPLIVFIMSFNSSRVRFILALLVIFYSYFVCLIGFNSLHNNSHYQSE
jgi:hypothetical protein